jgi:diadenosine tetraphosphate (Ap4A) HIT family hydrolase
MGTPSFTSNSAYSNKLIKDYEHWSLFLCSKQVSPGTTYIFPRRVVRSFSEFTSEEETEKNKIIGDLERALMNTWNPKRIVPFGSSSTPLHYHLFADYDRPIVFEGTRFDKGEPNNLYLPQHKVPMPPKAFEAMREIMRELLAS